ncbi:hypothetical protein BLOT_000487 [Blomia tropicalis]|nr:hypothetical protein BLOT_000487 [Blomia tropicalis]
MKKVANQVPPEHNQRKVVKDASKPRPTSSNKSAANTDRGPVPVSSNQSNLILVTTSMPKVDTVPPPPDERDFSGSNSSSSNEEVFNVKNIDSNGKELQILCNISCIEIEPQLVPDKELLQPQLSMDILLARLNSQLNDSSMVAVGSKEMNQYRIKGKQSSSQGKRISVLAKVNNNQPMVVKQQRERIQPKNGTQSRNKSNKSNWIETIVVQDDGTALGGGGGDNGNNGHENGGIDHELTNIEPICTFQEFHSRLLFARAWEKVKQR